MRRFVTAAALGLLSVPPVSADTGQAEMARVAAAYRTLQSCSYSGSATAYVPTAQGTQTIGSTSVVKVMKPNRIYMAVTNPQVGTVTYACDGKTAIAYSARTNQFFTRPAPATLSGVIELLNRGAQPVFGVAISALAYDMLYFLEGKPQLPGVSWSSKGSGTVEGASCVILVGTPTSGKAFRRATVWVDRAAHLIRKSELVLSGATVRQRAGAKPGAKMDVTIAENSLNLRTNPPLKDSDFRFTPPKGAVERNLEKYLKKS